MKVVRVHDINIYVRCEQYIETKKKLIQDHGKVSRVLGAPDRVMSLFTSQDYSIPTAQPGFDKTGIISHRKMEMLDIFIGINENMTSQKYFF